MGRDGTNPAEAGRRGWSGADYRAPALLSLPRLFCKTGIRADWPARAEAAGPQEQRQEGTLPLRARPPRF